MNHQGARVKERGTREVGEADKQRRVDGSESKCDKQREKSKRRGSK